MDLTPSIELAPAQLGKATRERALAELAELGRGDDALEPVGGAYWADLLFVTGRARTSLEPEETEALAKATAGLGYSPVQSALLSIADIGACPAGRGTHGMRPPQSKSNISAYIDVLSPQTLVFLEATAVPTGEDSLLPADAFPYCTVVVVTDFFGSLASEELKRVAWNELKQAKKASALS